MSDIQRTQDELRRKLTQNGAYGVNPVLAWLLGVAGVGVATLTLYLLSWWSALWLVAHLLLWKYWHKRQHVIMKCAIATLVLMDVALLVWALVDGLAQVRAYWSSLMCLFLGALVVVVIPPLLSTRGGRRFAPSVRRRVRMMYRRIIEYPDGHLEIDLEADALSVRVFVWGFVFYTILMAWTVFVPNNPRVSDAMTATGAHVTAALCATSDDVRSTVEESAQQIFARVLGSQRVERALGTVELTPEQREACAQLEALGREHGERFVQSFWMPKIIWLLWLLLLPILRILASIDNFQDGWRGFWQAFNQHRKAGSGGESPLSWILLFNELRQRLENSRSKDK